jgi:hypothetical protein
LNLGFTGQHVSFNFEFQNVSLSAFQRLTLDFTGQRFSASSLFPQFVPIRVIRVASFSMSAFQLLILCFPCPVELDLLLHRGLAREVLGSLLHLAGLWNAKHIPLGCFLLSYLPWKLVSDKLSA